MQGTLRGQEITRRILPSTRKLVTYKSSSSPSHCQDEDQSHYKFSMHIHKGRIRGQTNILHGQSLYRSALIQTPILTCIICIIKYTFYTHELASKSRAKVQSGSAPPSIAMSLISEIGEKCLRLQWTKMPSEVVKLKLEPSLGYQYTSTLINKMSNGK